MTIFFPNEPVPFRTFRILVGGTVPFRSVPDFSNRFARGSGPGSVYVRTCSVGIACGRDREFTCSVDFILCARCL